VAGRSRRTWAMPAVRALGDLDGDGDLDLIETSHHLLQSVIVRSHLNDGSGSFTPGPQTNLSIGVAFGTGPGPGRPGLGRPGGPGRHELGRLCPTGARGLAACAAMGRAPSRCQARAFCLASTSTITQAWVGPPRRFRRRWPARRLGARRSGW
jgi:hypothetical protein